MNEQPKNFAETGPIRPKIALPKNATMAEFFELLTKDEEQDKYFWKEFRQHVDLDGAALYEELQYEKKEEAATTTVIKFFTDTLKFKEEDIEKLFPIRFF